MIHSSYLIRIHFTPVKIFCSLRTIIQHIKIIESLRLRKQLQAVIKVTRDNNETVEDKRIFLKKRFTQLEEI